MAFFLSPIGNDQQCDANGNPLVGGTITTYQAGSSTPAATYTDSTGATPQANPITLNSLGLSASPIWLTGGQAYKFVIKDSSGVTIRTVDGVSGINDTALAGGEWLALGVIPTYVSATSFTVPGDQTSTLQIGRRLKTTNTSGSIYSTITNAVYTTLTTITVQNDSGTLDAGLSVVSYGLIAPNSSSWPQIATKNYNATTTGAAPTYVAAMSPTITALVANKTRVNLTLHAANSGAASTLNVDGLGAIGIKQLDSTGAKVDPTIAANMNSDAVYDGTHWVLLDSLSFNGLDTTRIDVASVATVDLTANAPNTRNINITGTTGISAFTVAAGRAYLVRFAASLTLANGAGLVTQTGANIVTQTGDTCILRATAANVVEVLSYSRVAQLTLGTAQATTSGTAIDFTSIPSWAKRITLSLVGVSTNGASLPQIQIGDSGGIVATSYSTSTSSLGSGAATQNTTTGFSLAAAANWAATAVISGSFTLTLVDAASNTWAGCGIFGKTAGAVETAIVAGSRALSLALSRIRLTTINGTDSFDAGLVNITYEG